MLGQKSFKNGLVFGDLKTTKFLSEINRPLPISRIEANFEVGSIFLNLFLKA
jgi:hypothetical protein